MAQLKALGIAIALDCVFGVREFADEKCLHPKIENRVAAIKAVAVDGVFVPRKRAAYLDAVVDLRLRIRAVHPEAAAALFYLVGHANRNRVEIGIETRHGRLEKDLAGQWLEFVVAKAGHVYRLDHESGIVAVASQDLDLLTVHQPVGAME